MDDLERFLDLVRRELRCDDARFEFGGRPPRSPSSVYVDLPGGWRVVAVFDAPRDLDGDQDDAATKLTTLTDTFTGVAASLKVRGPRVSSATASTKLDEALALLADKGDALRAVVIDEDSPVLWGTSEAPAGPEDVEVALWTGELFNSAATAGLDMVELVGLDDAAINERLANLEPRKLRQRLQRKLPIIRELGEHRDAAGWAAHFAMCRAIAAVRRAPEHHEAIEDDLGWLARDFAGIYHVILVYDGPFSEIGAAGVMLRALPTIEKLVLALPPIDPEPKGKGARVLPFRR